MGQEHEICPNPLKVSDTGPNHNCDLPQNTQQSLNKYLELEVLGPNGPQFLAVGLKNAQRVHLCVE